MHSKFTAFAFCLMFAPALATTAAGGHHEKKAEGGGAAVTSSDVKKDLSKAMQTLRQYSAAQRDKALDTGKDLMRAVDERIDALEEDIEKNRENLSRKAHAEKRAALRKLRMTRNTLSQRFGEMKHATGDAWADVRNGFADAWKELDHAINKSSP